MSNSREVTRSNLSLIGKQALIGGLLAAIAGFLYWFFLGPFGTIAGGYL